MHAECVAKHYPCSDGWDKSENSSAEDRPLVDKDARQEPTLPELAAVSTPPRQNTINPNADLARQLMEQAEALLKSGETQPTTPTYPQSLAKTGQHAAIPLANLGVAPDVSGNSGSAVQYGKPKDADSVKLLAFPKPGISFEK